MVAGSRRWLVAIGFCLMLLHNNAPNAENQRMKDGQQHRGVETIVLGMGCFWGAEKRMAQIPGVIDVESGYANGEVEARYEAILDHERTRARRQAARRRRMRESRKKRPRGRRVVRCAPPRAAAQASGLKRRRGASAG